MTTSQPAPRRPWPWAGIWGLLVVVSLLVYWPALAGEMLWDDTGHITRPDLQSWTGLGRIWFELGATQQYYPLLHSAFWLEHRLWADATIGYHLVNVVLHATAAALFAAVLRRLAVPGSTFAAFLFALHPVCVESVAWISEQKNTLSLCLYLGAALAYFRWDDARERRAYAVATLLFMAALLTKTVTATLPAALLVVAWWRRGRVDLRRDVRPLLPWFAMALVGGLVTAWVERRLIGAEGAAFELGWIERGLLAGRVIWFYFAKLLWPVDLAFVYPRWTVDSGEPWQYLFPLAAIGAAAVLRVVRGRGALATGLLFAGSLFPALGFFNVYPFIFSWVADHFQYLASLAVFSAAGFGMARLVECRPVSGRVVGAAALLALGALSWRQAGIFRDPVTLFEATLRQNPACWMAHNNLAEVLTQLGRPAEAIPHLTEALKLRPDFAEAENNLGDDLRRLGRAAEALPHLEKSLHLRPAFVQAHNNLGIALMELGRASEGMAQFERALKLNPAFALAHANLGLALAQNGRASEALPHFKEAIRLDPDYADAELNWGITLTLTDGFAAAEPHFEKALRLQPNSAAAHASYGRALTSAGRYEEAVSHLREALEFEPTSANLHLNLADTFRKMGKLEDAQAHYQAAQQYRR